MYVIVCDLELSFKYFTTVNIIAHVVVVERLSANTGVLRVLWHCTGVIQYLYYHTVQVLSVIRRCWIQSRSLNGAQTTTVVLGGAGNTAGGTALLRAGADTRLSAGDYSSHLLSDVTAAEADLSKRHRQINPPPYTAAAAEPMCCQHEWTDESWHLILTHSLTHSLDVSSSSSAAAASLSSSL